MDMPTVAHFKIIEAIKRNFGSDAFELSVENTSIRFKVSDLEFLFLIVPPVKDRWKITLVNPDGYRYKTYRKMPTDLQLDEAIDSQIRLAGSILFHCAHIRPLQEREIALRNYSGPKLVVGNCSAKT